MSVIALNLKEERMALYTVTQYYNNLSVFI